MRILHSCEIGLQMCINMAKIGSPTRLEILTILDLSSVTWPSKRGWTTALMVAKLGIARPLNLMKKISRKCSSYHRWCLYGTLKFMSMAS